MDAYSIRLPTTLKRTIQRNARMQSISVSEYIRQQLELAQRNDLHPQLVQSLQSLQQSMKFTGVASLQALFLIHKMLSEPLPINEAKKHLWLNETLQKAKAEIEKNLAI